MKVRHLLTMATGHSREPWNFRDNQESDWVYAFLSSYVDREPGSQFVYNTPASYMLSAIVQKCTGMTVCEYLRPRLFDPWTSMIYGGRHALGESIQVALG
ncbi:MAG: serine hydrolase [Clostridia bacterium]